MEGPDIRADGSPEFLELTREKLNEARLAGIIGAEQTLTSYGRELTKGAFLYEAAAGTLRIVRADVSTEERDVLGLNSPQAFAKMLRIAQDYYARGYVAVKECNSVGPSEPPCGSRNR